MQLLVSVANAADASEAVSGGADIVDAKDPLAGPLGPVTLEVFETIRRAAEGRPLSAALGDPHDEQQAEQMARLFAAGGADLVKVAFAGARGSADVATLTRAAVRGARSGHRHADGRPLTGVIAVAYADCPVVGIFSTQFVEIARAAGAVGVLLDTVNKQGPGLRTLLPHATLASWVAAAADARLLIALAGRLTAEDVSALMDLDADVVGVRGAACQGGRSGKVTASLVRDLTQRCRRGQAASVASDRRA